MNLNMCSIGYIIHILAKIDENIQRELDARGIRARQSLIYTLKQG